MVRYRTRVRQIVFVETREAPGMFIGSLSPEKPEQALVTRFPYGQQEGAEQVRKLWLNSTRLAVERCFQIAV